MNRTLKSIFLLLTAYCLLLTVNAQTRDFSRWVNPFIGTGGHGHTFPGATLPFGMVQLSPDTRIDNWDGSSGYHYSDDIIYGFSHTHLSGTGIPDGCDILFMPTVDSNRRFAPWNVNAKKGERDYGTYYASTFSHTDEAAQPGYYSVRIDDRKLLVELTSTARVGFHRYTFPQSSNAAISLDLSWRDQKVFADQKVVGTRRVEGVRHSRSWAKDQKVYFVAEFSKPFRGIGGGGDYETGSNGLTFGFNTRANEQILVKVAISHVSIEGARKNLEAELPHWDFDKVRSDAKAAWNKELSKIEVSGGTDDQTTNFYTALYHTMIHPSVFSDADGRYRGHDGKVHNVWSPGFSRPTSSKKPPKGGTPNKGGTPSASEHYTVFSLWDTFRAAHPLHTIIDQRRTVDFINTFIRIYEQGGRLPVWELWGEETDTMIGYHAVSVIADAMSKGIKGFDYEKAYAAAKHSAQLDHFGLAGYKKRGYISMEDENESVSKTLEYAYNDWCIAQMAAIRTHTKMLEVMAQGKDFSKDAETTQRAEEFSRYLLRSLSYMNLFDPETNFFRPKGNGRFLEPFAPNEVTFHFTEGNSWQYSFFVPHDVNRLVELMGGREKFAAKLDELFTTDQKLTGRKQPDITGLIGQYAHGNEPSHHIPYLYNYAGQSWKTQKYIRKIMDEFYKNTPDGLIGNEDCGQMSAWYVLSASGIYPVVPGSHYYEIGTPLFPEIKYRLENGKTFTVRAKNVSNERIYIQSVKLNGSAYKTPFVSHENIMNGSVIEFVMTARSGSSAFTESPVPSPLAVPFVVNVPFVPVPLIVGERVFNGQTTVTLKTVTPNTRITYTIDNYGEEFARKTQTYMGPFTIDGTTRVEAYATGIKTGVESMKVEAIFTKRPNDWTVRVISPYSTQYTGGGDDAIVDGIRGTVNFASGEWQGIQGKPYEAVVDLQRETEIKSVGGSFLQVASPWIWMPERIEFETSMDGVHFTRVAEIKPGFRVREMTPTIKEYRQKITTTTRARYVRMRAFNFGKIPSWHPGAGGDPWIFIDEIFID